MIEQGKAAQNKFWGWRLQAEFEILEFSKWLTMNHSPAVHRCIDHLAAILAGASYDSTARLWDLENAQPSARPSLQHGIQVICVSFSADGHLPATRSLTPDVPRFQ